MLGVAQILTCCSSFAGDEMFADSYPVEEVHDGFFYQVEGKVGSPYKMLQTRFLNLHGSKSKRLPKSSMPVQLLLQGVMVYNSHQHL